MKFHKVKHKKNRCIRIVCRYVDTNEFYKHTSIRYMQLAYRFPSHQTIQSNPYDLYKWTRLSAEKSHFLCSQPPAIVTGSIWQPPGSERQGRRWQTMAHCWASVVDAGPAMNDRLSTTCVGRERIPLAGWRPVSGLPAKWPNWKAGNFDQNRSPSAPSPTLMPA